MILRYVISKLDGGRMGSIDGFYDGLLDFDPTKKPFATRKRHCHNNDEEKKKTKLLFKETLKKAFEVAFGAAKDEKEKQVFLDLQLSLKDNPVQNIYDSIFNHKKLVNVDEETERTLFVVNAFLAAASSCEPLEVIEFALENNCEVAILKILKGIFSAEINKEKKKELFAKVVINYYPPKNISADQENTFSKIARAIAKGFNQPEVSDFQLSIGDQVVHLNSDILKDDSELFKKKSPPLCLDDPLFTDNCELTKIALMFTYTKTIDCENLNQNDLKKLQEIGKLLGLSELFFELFETQSQIFSSDLTQSPSSSKADLTFSEQTEEQASPKPYQEVDWDYYQ